MCTSDGPKQLANANSHKPRECHVQSPIQVSTNAPSPTYCDATYASAPSQCPLCGGCAEINCAKRVDETPHLAGDGRHPENSDRYMQTNAEKRHTMYFKHLTHTGISGASHSQIQTGDPGYLNFQNNKSLATLEWRGITHLGWISSVIRESISNMGPEIYLVFTTSV